MNTSYFHKLLKWRRVNNAINIVKIGGDWCEEPTRIQEEKKIFFTNRLRQEPTLGIKMDDVEFSSLTQEVNLMLTEKSIKIEIRKAV